MGSSVQILLLEKHAGLRVATLKSLQTSKIRIPKSPKYKTKNQKQGNIITNNIIKK